MKIELLMRKMKRYHPQADVGLISKAYELSKKLHFGQKRKSGEDYIEHPLAVAGILAELGLDEVSIAAGLLHDVLEDTSYSYEQLKKEFGKEIADIVEGVSKIRAMKRKAHASAENIKKMLLATSKDMRVVLVKLADKLHNMRTLQYLEEEKRKRIAQEVLEVYAPLAYRLGLAGMKWELEDLGFKELHPDVYAEFQERVAQTRKQRERDVEMLKKELVQALKKQKLKGVEISGRSKNFYSIYKKMLQKGKKFEEIYDLIGLRVILQDVNDCYEALGVVHQLWKPMPGKFKDYIARPKENFYQSLHTVAISDSGLRVEVQIRTREMDALAEEGVAAHFRYKGMQSGEKFDQKLGWMKQILELKHAPGQEFLQRLQMDIFGDKVYVFTPKGDVVELPAGSCVVDFAYAVHTDLGNKCVGGRINDTFVSLRHTLQSGDVVEVVTSKNRVMPSRDWLKFVKSPKALQKIRHALQLVQHIPAGSMQVRMQENEGRLIVLPMSRAAVQWGKCCSPLPGQSIVGLASRSNRVMIHAADCEQMRQRGESSKQRVQAEWKEHPDCEVLLQVVSLERVGLFADVLNTVAALGKNILKARAFAVGKQRMLCEFRLQIGEMRELEQVIQRVQKVKDVKEIHLAG